MSIFRRVSFLASAFVSLVVLAACGGNGAGPTSPTPSEGDATAIEEESRTVTSDDGKLTLKIPPEAVDEDVPITITSVPLEELPQALQEVQGAGDGYKLEPEGLRFLGPVTVSLELDRAELEDEPEGEITAYVLVSLTEDGERELLDEPVTEATLGEDTIVVRGELSHFSWLTRTKSSLTFSLEKVDRVQPVGGKFTAKMKAKNTDNSGRVTIGIVSGDLLDFGAVSRDQVSSSFTLSVGGLAERLAGEVTLEPGQETNEGTAPFQCADSPGRGTYGVRVLSISKVTVPDEPEGEILTVIKLVIDSVIECVAPTPTPTPMITAAPTPSPTSDTASDPDVIELSDPKGDATDCATGAAVDDPAVDISGVNVSKVGETIMVEVVPVQSPETSLEDFSFAIIVLLFGFEGLAEIHAGLLREGFIDSGGSIIAGSEGQVTWTDGGVGFTFPNGDSIPKGSPLEIRAFHTETEGGAVNCDTFEDVYSCFGRCDD